MIDFCILGSGIAGSTIASLLSKKYTVEVFDKARGPGGRTSNKKLKSNLNFDHGTQYYSPKNNKFKAFLQKLIKNKIIKTWDGNHFDFFFEKKQSTNKYIGKIANNDICKYQLEDIKQNYSSNISKINFKKNYWEITLQNQKKYNFKNLILTCPYPQAKKLAKKYLSKKMLNLNVKMMPNITLMVALKNNIKLDISSIKFNDDILAWAANENSKKRFKSKINLWTLQSTLKWARKNINLYKNNKKIGKILERRFLELLGFKKDKVFYRNIHGWKYSYNNNPTNKKSYWNKSLRIGICGDWFLGPKAEDAWTSANSLFKSIK